MRGVRPPTTHSHVRKCPKGADNNARAFAPNPGPQAAAAPILSPPLPGKATKSSAQWLRCPYILANKFEPSSWRSAANPSALLVPLNARDKHAFRFINQTQQKATVTATATTTGRMTVEMGEKLQRTSGKRKRNYQRANKMLSRVRRSFKFSSGDKWVSEREACSIPIPLYLRWRSLCSLRFDGTLRYATFLFRCFFISSTLIRHFGRRYSPDYGKDNARAAIARPVGIVSLTRAHSLRRQVLPIAQQSLALATLHNKVQCVQGK